MFGQLIVPIEAELSELDTDGVVATLTGVNWAVVAGDRKKRSEVVDVFEFDDEEPVSFKSIRGPKFAPVFNGGEKKSEVAEGSIAVASRCC
jgi:hypothetical protein